MTTGSKSNFPASRGRSIGGPAFVRPIITGWIGIYGSLGFHLIILTQDPYPRQREQWLYQLLAKLLHSQPDSSRRPWLHLLDRETSRYLQTHFTITETGTSLRQGGYVSIPHGSFSLHEGIVHRSPAMVESYIFRKPRSGCPLGSLDPATTACEAVRLYMSFLVL
jgi:hypothetical protein